MTVAGALLLGGALVLWGCGGKPQPGRSAGAAHVPQPVVAEHGGAGAAVSAAQPDAGPPPFDEPAPRHPIRPITSVDPGDWIEASSYRVRLERIDACGGAGPEGELVGPRIRYEARVDDVFFSPRDWVLQSGGIIVATEPAPRCNPGGTCCAQLPAQRLRKGQRIEGALIFAVPKSLRASNKPIVLAYRPTRWGGSARVEIRMPTCLDTCGESATEEKRAAPKRK